MIPSRHRSVVLFTALAPLILWLLGCDSRSPTEPDPNDILNELTSKIETDHFVFHFAPGDTVDPERQEAHYRWATARLGIGLPQKLEFFKYRDRAHIQRLTGRNANGWAAPETYAVHSILPYNPHEAVHVYSSLVGRPSDFFNEGIAVALSTDPMTGDYEPTYDGVTPVHSWARDQLRMDALLPLADVVSTSDFRSIDEWTGYQEAGSFLQFLDQRYGFDLLLSYFAHGGRNDSRESIRADFLATYGFSLEEGDRRWREFLGGG